MLVIPTILSADRIVAIFDFLIQVQPSFFELIKRGFMSHKIQNWNAILRESWLRRVYFETTIVFLWRLIFGKVLTV